MNEQTVKIEKGIPIPKSRGKLVTQQMEAMEVGDSFECSTVRAYALVGYANRHLKGLRFTSRKVGEGKSRVWRTA